jgi:hypothetical protein
MLTHLDHCAPGVRSELLFAVVALHVKFGELSDKGLFHFGLVVDFFFDGDFDLDSFGMALSPDEAGIDDFGFVESLDFFKQEGEEFLTVAITSNPWGSHVPVTESAEVDNGLLGNPDGNVGFGNGTS